MGPVEKLLREAGELIRDKGKWCTGDYAIDADGCPVSPCDPSACRWCSVGALAHVSGSDDWGVGLLGKAQSLLNAAAVEIRSSVAFALNDEAPKLIDDMFSEAIEAAHVLESEGRL